MTAQPYEYRRTELVEPDWTRFPGWRDVTRDEWESAQWQRAHCVQHAKQLRMVLGELVDHRFYDDLAADQARFATMSMLLPPQMLNTMSTGDTSGELASRSVATAAFYADPIRRSMIPVAAARPPAWPTPPHASRDSLHEHDMWV